MYAASAPRPAPRSVRELSVWISEGLTGADY